MGISEEFSKIVRSFSAWLFCAAVRGTHTKGVRTGGGGRRRARGGGERRCGGGECCGIFRGGGGGGRRRLGGGSRFRFGEGGRLRGGGRRRRGTGFLGGGNAAASERPALDSTRSLPPACPPKLKSIPSDGSRRPPHHVHLTLTGAARARRSAAVLCGRAAEPLLTIRGAT